MGLVTFRSKAHDDVGGTGTTTISVPSGTVNGDVMVAVICFKGGDITTGVPASVTDPAGWTLILDSNVTVSTQVQSLRSLYRVASGEPANYTWTSDTPNSLFNLLYGHLLSYSGVANNKPLDVTSKSAGNTFGSPLSLPILTVSNADLVLSCISSELADTGSPGNMVQREIGVGTGQGTADALQRLPETFTPNSWASSSQVWVAHTIALTADPGVWQELDDSTLPVANYNPAALPWTSMS